MKSAAFHELVDRARRGDRTAAETLVAWIHPAIVRYCRARIGRTGSAFATADDVAQEIILGVLKAIPRFADESSAFMPFVYGIASNKVADHYRRVARDRCESVADLPELPDTGASPEHLAVRGELTSRMAALLEEIAPRQRDILILRMVVGLTATEIASTLCMSPTAVRVAQHRALGKLRGRLRAEDWL
ncbi:RNA polymerase sigma factor ShbA [Actinokineospora sp. NPDC004072]